MNILTDKDKEYLYAGSKTGRKDYAAFIPLDVVDRIKRQIEYYEAKEIENNKPKPPKDRVYENGKAPHPPSFPEDSIEKYGL